MADKIQKSIEFKGDKAAKEINKITKSLERTITALLSVQYTVNKVNFDGLTTSLQKFVKDFSKISNMSKEVENIRVMAQALNRFKMVAIELNKADFSVSFQKITKGIYSFMYSVNRISSLEKNIMIIAELGRALNRLVNTSVKLQSMKVSFTSITQAIYAFVGSILRIKDLDEAVDKLNKMADAIDRVKKSAKTFRVNSITKSLNSTNNKVKETNKNFEKMEKTQISMSKTLTTIGNGIQTVARRLQTLNLSYVYYWAKRLGNVMYDLVKVYASYQENINLATVAYYGLTEAEARLYPFAENMSKAFGLNESELIRSVGLFKQMANAMRLTQEQSDLLSQGLTKMAYDISSLYNISFDRAMSALQSSLVGQTKPIRGATGADITENTLRITLQDLGIEKEIRDLSYVEKRLVMVISLTKQLANAQGDLARTIESPANQLKVLSQQLERLRIALGNVLNIFLSGILPVLNGFVMALVEIINLVAEALKTLLNFQDIDYDYDNLVGIGDAADEIIDGMEEANKQVEELKNNVLGIDELNILEKQDTLSMFEGIDPTILDAFTRALETWDNRMEEVNMKAYEIRDAILDWVGLEPTEDGWGLKNGESLARTFKETLDSIDVTKLKEDFYEIFKAIGMIIAGSIVLKIVLNPMVLIAGGIYIAFKKIKEIIDKGKISLEDFSALLGGISAVILGLGIMFFNPMLATIGAIGLAISGILASIDNEKIRAFFESLKPLFEDILNILKRVWEEAEVVGVILVALGILIKNPVLIIVGGLLTLVKALTDETSYLGKALKVLWNDILKPILEALLDNLKVIWSKFQPALEKLWQALNDLWEIFSALVSFLVTIFAPTIGNVAVIILNSLGTTIEFMIGLVRGLSEVLSGLIDFLMGTFTGDFDRALKGIKNLLVGFLNLAINMVESAINTIINLINLALSSIYPVIKTIWNGVAGVIEAIAKVAGIKLNVKLTSDTIRIPKVNIPRVPTYANGGYPDKGLFMMNEGNGAEMLGTINGRTAVVNNDQIAGALANALAPLLGTVVTAVENVAASDRPIVLYADSREIARASQSGSKKLGYNPIGGEFANV